MKPMKVLLVALCLCVCTGAAAFRGTGMVAVLQAQGCTFTLSRQNVLAGPEGRIVGSTTVTASAPGCTWSATTAAPWLTLFYGASGSATGTGNLAYTLAENTTGATRTATIAVAGMTVTVTQQATPCVTSLTPSALTFPFPGFGDPAEQSKDVAVDAPPDCHWQHSPWPIYLSPNPTVGGIGPGVVHGVSIILIPQGNTITAGIGSLPLTLTRLEPSCVFSLSPSNATVGVNGGSGTVTVNGTGTDCHFTATTSGESGLSITQSSAVVPATVSYTMMPNPGRFPRTASFGVPNAGFSIQQNGAPVKTDVSFLWLGAVSSGGALTTVSPAEGLELTIDEQPASAWTATSSQPWLVVSPTSGAGPATLRVTIDTAAGAALAPGERFTNFYVGEIRMTAAFAPATAIRTVTASLAVKTADQTEAPFGVFETPLNNTIGASGAIPVTGWAVDDIDLSRIRIFRDPVAGEGSAEIFIGDAIRVMGARPDIAAFTRPQARRAGWGYQLLSNVLPGRGNGTFTFSADAEDVDGHRVRLGRKTVTFDNARATRPFGTIDGPGQGETVSGTILNFGWVLTPAGKAIPFDGSTIKVYIDGALLSPVTSYNHPRPDVKAYFPGLGNSDGPEARLSIDTTMFADGVHTIAWGVIDDAGVAEGIGSRYFTIQNFAGSQVLAPADTARSASSVKRLPVLKTDVWSRDGVDEAGWAVRVETDAAGNRTVRATQGQRIELFLDPTLQAPCGTYQGHLLAGDVAGAFPAGASLDAQHGLFRWQPSPQFTGTYRFTFVQRGCDGAERVIPLSVIIGSR